MRMNRILSAALLITAFASEAVLAEQGTAKTVLVVPSRTRMVQFAMDIARLRPTYVVAYGTRSSPTDVALYLWSDKAQEWKDISAEEYGNGSVLDASAQSLALVGSKKDVPSELLQQPEWATKSVRIESLNAAEMANALDRSMHFTPTEWRWLARRYDITLTDLNSERRRYGKYGPPGSKARPEQTEAPAPVPTAGDVLKNEPAALEPEAPKFDVMPAPKPTPQVKESKPAAQADSPDKKKPEDK
jgi:hypothetical protein